MVHKANISMNSTLYAWLRGIGDRMGARSVPGVARAILVAVMHASESEAFHRTQDTKPYVKGNFVIDSLEEASPAQDDATYSGQLSNSGEPDIYPGKAAA